MVDNRPEEDKGTGVGSRWVKLRAKAFIPSASNKKGPVLFLTYCRTSISVDITEAMLKIYKWGLRYLAPIAKTPQMLCAIFQNANFPFAVYYRIFL
jgi:hypothetical protein